MKRLVVLLCLISAVWAADPKICLTIVVKNDEGIIKECLNSVKGVIDCLAICDIGSSDNTISLVKEFMQEAGIPGSVSKYELMSSGENKTQAIQAAQSTLKKLNYPLAESYILVLAPSNKLRINSRFKKEALKDDVYQLIEKSSSLSFFQYLPRLVRASLPWVVNGSITESWSCQQPYTSVKLADLIVEERPNSPEVLKVQVELLRQEQEKDAGNGHKMFLLAQTLKTFKDYHEAIYWYKNSIDKGSDNEEVWFSKYMIAECFRELGVWESALYWYLEAFQFNPNRVEPLVKLTNHYRWNDKNDLAVLFGSHAMRIPSPENQRLFETPPMEDFRLLEDLSIVSYYTRFKERGYAAADDLILNKNVPDWMRQQAYRNIIYYVPLLKNAVFKQIDIELPLIRSGLPDRYNPMNPTIVRTESGFKLICRTVNFTQKGAKHYTTVDLDGVFKTKNFLIQYDRLFNKLSQQEIIDDLPRERVSSWLSAVSRGLDDCRLFQYKNADWVTCSTNDTNPAVNFQISLCKLGDARRGDPISVKKLTPLLGPDPYLCEKNWLPFVHENVMKVIYGYEPFTIYQPDVETGVCEKVVEYDPDYHFSSFRGSAGPLEFDDGYLVLVHEVVFLADFSRIYLHRFLYLDKAFNIKKTSRPFMFKHLGIEYSCGMVIDHAGTNLIMSIGIEDREAHLCSVDLLTVRSLLLDLPAAL